jgi:hypothetical protein
LQSFCLDFSPCFCISIANENLCLKAIVHMFRVYFRNHAYWTYLWLCREGFLFLPCNN